MLPGWLEDLLTPCPRPLRAMGYLRELRGIRERGRLWAAAWAPHLGRTRELIRAALRRCAARRKAVVLGSGWLNDVPLAELAGAFAEVVLVDAVHPRAARRQARRWANVSLRSADVTGTAEAVWRVAWDRRATLPRSAPELFCGDGEVDLVASVNLLSQLPCLPERYLLEAGSHAPDAIATYGRDVVQAHLDYLRRLPGVVALVTDVEAWTVAGTGRVVRRADTLFGARLPWQGESWTWPLVPRRRAFPHHAQHLRVVGVVDVKTAPPAP
jgi:hypothetical protein